MQILKGNILSPENLKKYDAVCVTSNGVLKKNGELVMGAGIAKAFKEKWPELPKIFGFKVKHYGNCVNATYPNSTYNEPLKGPPAPDCIIAFPTKHHWRNPSDIKLIKKSANELMQLIEDIKLNNVALTKPGCGMGGLEWADVKKVIEPIFDNRITIFYL